MPNLFHIERIGNQRSNIKWQEGQREKIAELYQQKYSIRQISRMFGGLHYNTIKKVLKEYDIPLRTPAQSHYQDNRCENIFENIDTEEKAYWLGFLCGDGCVFENYIRISLHKKDIHHLEKFRTFVKADSIHIRSSGEYCSFSIGCKKMAEDLKKWGCVERKSLILKVPSIDENLICDWLRGLFDANGGISYVKKANRWQSYLTSTKEVCDFYISFLGINTKPFKEHRCKNNTYRVHFNGRLSVLKKLNVLYRQNTATIYLDRKYALYQQLLSTLQQ